MKAGHRQLLGGPTSTARHLAKAGSFYKQINRAEADCSLMCQALLFLQFVGVGRWMDVFMILGMREHLLMPLIKRQLKLWYKHRLEMVIFI